MAWSSGRLIRKFSLNKSALAASRSTLPAPNLQYLASVVPLVDRLIYVQSLVALQANQLGAQSVGQGACDLGLADTGFPLQEQGPLQLHRQEYGHCQRPV